MLIEMGGQHRIDLACAHSYPSYVFSLLSDIPQVLPLRRRGCTVQLHVTDEMTIGTQGHEGLPESHA